MKLVLNNPLSFLLNSFFYILSKTKLQFKKFLYFQNMLNFLNNRKCKDSQIFVMMKFQKGYLKDWGILKSHRNNLLLYYSNNHTKFAINQFSSPTFLQSVLKIQIYHYSLRFFLSKQQKMIKHSSLYFLYCFLIKHQLI